MTTFRLELSPSPGKGEKGQLHFSVSHRRIARRLAIDVRLYERDWDSRRQQVKKNRTDDKELAFLAESVAWHKARMRRVIAQMDSRGEEYTTDDLLAYYHTLSQSLSTRRLFNELIRQMAEDGQLRTAEAYSSALRRFLDFREGRDMPLDGFRTQLIRDYQTFLFRQGLQRNTSSFYMRILRAVYNRAVDREWTEQKLPFRHVFTGVETTRKRALSAEDLRAVVQLDLSGRKERRLALARDLFMFSFYTRGMSFVDMAYLRKRDISDGMLTYRRRKTGQRLTVRWEPCMGDIARKYNNPDSLYLFPILQNGDDERKECASAQRLANIHLRHISKLLSMQRPITMYAARHSWASIAHSHNIPLAVISEGMGHQSERTTRIYLKSIENSIIDRANQNVIALVWQPSDNTPDTPATPPQVQQDAPIGKRNTESVEKI